MVLVELCYLGAIHGFYLIFANQTAIIRNKIISSLWLKHLAYFLQYSSGIDDFGLTSFVWIFPAKDFQTASLHCESLIY